MPASCVSTTIAYGGEADEAFLKEVAEHTNARMFKGSTEDIAKIYLSISSYF